MCLPGSVKSNSMFVNKYFVIAVSLVILACVNGHAQSKEELERRRKETQEIIDNTSKLLEQTSVTRQSSMEQLNILNRRLQLRQSLTATLQSEIRYIENGIENKRLRISELENELKEARAAYARLIQIAYKHRFSHQRIMFILAANDFNQAYRRYKYLQQYAASRRNQIERISVLTNEIVSEIELLESNRQEQVLLFRRHQEETRNIARESEQHDEMVRNLRKRERELKSELENQQKIAASLQQAIEDLLREEARRAAEARVYELTPEQKILSDRFENNRGALPWPTERGVVTGFFGEHPHPVLRGIRIQNDGIIISTVENADVKAVFDGDVRQVRTIPGLNNVVLIRHGNFLSVYANLSHVFVRSGDTVRTGQLIGRVFTDADEGNKSVLHLGIWEENRKLDPMLWLSRQ